MHALGLAARAALGFVGRLAALRARRDIVKRALLTVRSVLELASHVLVVRGVAALTAYEDPRVAAVCINGGTDRPTEILDRYPRFISEMQQMTGHDVPAEARAAIDRLTFDGERLYELRCPLHVVHGTPDRAFRVEGARRVHDGAASVDKTLTEYADGDHCVTNRSGSHPVRGGRPAAP